MPRITPLVTNADPVVVERGERERTPTATTNSTASDAREDREAAACVWSPRVPAAADRRRRAGRALARLAQAGPEQQQQEQRDERQRRPKPGRARCPSGGSRRSSCWSTPRRRPPSSASGMLVSRPNAAAAIAATSSVKKSTLADLGEERGEQHAGEAGEQARQHPREGPDAVGVDPGELGHARALDHRPHLQPEVVHRNRIPSPSTTITVVAIVTT